MKIFLETERLILREIISTDQQGLFEIDSDPEVNIYLGRNPVKTIDQTIEIIAFIRKQYIDNGIGRWAMIEKKTNKFIGWTGLKLVKELTNNHVEYYDLGYRLNRNYWGQGLATEAAKGCLNYGFTELKLKEIYAMADSNNSASRHVLEKTGLKYIETFSFNETPHDWFKISKM
jgi:ribosomal-protein-alanine N-acetyltransferase